MTLKYLILGGSALLLGFLFYPRGEVTQVVGDQQLIQPVRRLDNEPLHYTDILRADPSVTTYDLGFVYRIDKAEIRFDNPEESGPKQYDLLIHTDRTSQRFIRAFSYTGNSREYTYPLQSFAVPMEARWMQVVINDWFSNRPKLKAEEFRVGVRYQSHSPIIGITANSNSSNVALQKLIDLIPFEESKWVGAQRIERTVKGDKGTEKEITYRPPSGAIEVTVELGTLQKIYGVRVTTDGPGNNLKRYQILISADGQRYTALYVSDTLPDETVTDLHLLDSPTSARFVRLRMESGDWYGEYPELREFEVFTDNYRLPPPVDYQLNDYNAVQMQYENLGESANAFAPHLIQGFAFDRDTGDGNRYFLPEGDDAGKVDVGNTPSQKSFAYHYDTVKIKYTGLSPELLYWVQVSYLQEKGGMRIQNFNVDGFLLHDAIRLPQGKAKLYTYPIPREAYADGEITLNFNRLAGPNAAVSEVFILEAYPTSPLSPLPSRGGEGGEVGRAIRMSEKVVIDGKIDEWPLLYPMLPQNYKSLVDSPVGLYTQWDDDNLYVAAVINRQVRVLNEAAYRERKGLGDSEALHLFVDADLNRSPGMYKAGDHHFVFTIFNPQGPQPQVLPSQIHHHLDSIPKNIDYRKDIEAKVRRAGLGYVLEARIPKNLVLKAFQPAIGKSIGLNYIMTNLQLTNGRFGWFAYATDNPNASPNRWNEVELLNQIRGQVVLMDAHVSHPIPSFNAGDILTLCVWDAERNTDRHQSESIEAELRNDTTGESRTVLLREADFTALADDNPDNDFTTNSSLFAAKIPTAYGEAREREGEGTREPGSEEATPITNHQSPVTNHQSPLIVRGKDKISLTYMDAYYSSTQRDRSVSASATVNTGATGTISITTETGEPLEEFQAGDRIYIQVEDADLPAGTNGADVRELNSHTNSKQEEEWKNGRMEGEKSETLSPQSSNLPSIQPSTSTHQPEIEVNLVIPETKEIEPAKMTYQPENKRYVASIATVYSETPQPSDGVLQVVGLQVVWAIYLDRIQTTGETNVLVRAETRVKIGDTARLEFIPQGEQFVLNNRKFFKAGDSLSILMHDTDLNRDDNLQDTVEVTLSGSLLGDQRQIRLTETTGDSGDFTGTCPTQYATEAPPWTGGDSSNDEAGQTPPLQVTGKEVVTLSFIDALQGSGEPNVLVTDEAYVRSGEDGTLQIVKSNYFTDLELFNAGDKLYFRLRDADIVGEAVDTLVTGNVLNDQERVHLFQSSEVATFTGSIDTVYGTRRADDGKLQVQGGEQIRAIYIDALRATGETNVEVSDTCVANVGTTGSLKVYNQLHFLPDSDENVGISKFRAGDTLILEIRDADLNTTNAVAQLFETDWVENTVRDNIRVLMTEVAGSAGVFRGEIKTSYGETSIPNDDILQVQGAGIVTFTYIDALQDTGRTQVPIHVELSVETGDTGELAIYGAASLKLISRSDVGTGSFNAGERLRIQLRDKDLNVSPTEIDTAKIIAYMENNGLADEVLFILRETGPNSAIFEGDLQTQQVERSEIPHSGVEQKSLTQREPANRGEIPSIGGEQAVLEDDILQVTDKEVIRIAYTDEITATGETEVRPQIQAVVLSSSAGVLRIVDANNLDADLVVDHELGSFNAGETIYFWLEDLLLSTVVKTDRVRITVTGDKTKDEVKVTLRKKAETEGIFVASVPTRYGTTPIADGTLDVQGGEEVRAIYTPDFEGVNTQPVEDHTYVKAGVTGRLAIVQPDGTIIHNFNIGIPLYFRLEDPDLNRDPFVVESANITVKTNTPEAPTVITLYEENANSHIFKGSILTQYGRSSSLPQLGERGAYIGLVGGEIVTATYADALIDTGETNVEISASCRANLIAWAPYTSKPLLIDGLDDRWPLEKGLRTPQDEGLLWLQWDKDALYLLAQIYDDNVVVPDATQYYQGADALELHFNLQPSEGGKPTYLQTESEPNRYIIWICPKGGGFGGDQPYVGQWVPERIYNYEATNLEVAVRLESNFYVIEARIPFFPVLRGFDPLKTKRNNRIGFNFVIHRSNDQPVYWAEPMPGTEPVPPSDLGTLFLESPVP